MPAGHAGSGTKKWPEQRAGQPKQVTVERLRCEAELRTCQPHIYKDKDSTLPVAGEFHRFVARARRDAKQ
jgi:hypothetical protein